MKQLKKQKIKKKLIPLLIDTIVAGVPVFNSHLIENELNLHDYIVKNPNSTYFMRVAGDSMIDAGIFDNDILVVDKSLTPNNNNIIIAEVNNELTVKRLIINHNQIILRPENKKYNDIVLHSYDELIIWGNVISVVRIL